MLLGDHESLMSTALGLFGKSDTFVGRHAATGNLCMLDTWPSC